VLRRIFGSKRDVVTGVGDNCILKSFITCTLSQVYADYNYSDEIREFEIDMARSTHGVEEEYV
jgi:hypothetical protein